MDPEAPKTCGSCISESGSGSPTLTFKQSADQLIGLDYLEPVEGVFVGGGEQVGRHRLKAHCLPSVDKPAQVKSL
jgi:hypothetical protein